MTDKHPAIPGKTTWGTRRQILSPVAVALATGGVWAVLLLILATGQACNPKPAAPPAGPFNWDDTIGPLLARECVVCHGGSSNLYLDSYENAMQGGRRGPEIIPGHSKESRIIRALRGAEPGLPLNRPALSDDVINRIAAWIDAGAPKAAGQSAPPATSTPVPQAATPTLKPAATVAPAATNTPLLPTPAPTKAVAASDTPPADAPSAAKGADLWKTLPCKGCHGDAAEGGFGPKLVGTSLSLAHVQKEVRRPSTRMPAFSLDKVSDQDLKHVCAWLRSK